MLKEEHDRANDKTIYDIEARIHSLRAADYPRRPVGRPCKNYVPGRDLDNETKVRYFVKKIYYPRNFYQSVVQSVCGQPPEWSIEELVRRISRLGMPLSQMRTSLQIGLNAQMWKVWTQR